MKSTAFKMTLLCGLLIAASSCTREDTPIPEIPPSEGTQLTLQGGEGNANAINAVYVDLTSETQTPVARNSWNLGFHAGNEFRVILNNQTESAALATNATDITTVNASNVNINELTFSQTAPRPDFKLYDDTLGRITHTAIAEISATAAENRVYVINPQIGATVDAANLWKIRVQRNGNSGYTLQYGRLADTNFQTATINKDANFNFQYFSFTQGPVQVEPQKANWDFVWSRTTYLTVFENNAVPYGFSDIIFTNYLAGVQAAEVIIGENDFNISYTDFNESHLNQVAFSNNRDVIGANWRITAGANVRLGVIQNRYYILRDSANNIYKIRFISMGSGTAANGDGGTRGFPELEYQLVRRG